MCSGVNIGTGRAKISSRLNAGAGDTAFPQTPHHYPRTQTSRRKHKLPCSQETSVRPGLNCLLDLRCSDCGTW